MSKKPRNIVGPIVRKLRYSKRSILTQEQLATKLQLQDWQIDRFGVSKIERGEREVTDKELLMLANALGVKIIEFFPDT